MNKTFYQCSRMEAFCSHSKCRVIEADSSRLAFPTNESFLKGGTLIECLGGWIGSFQGGPN